MLALLNTLCSVKYRNAKMPKYRNSEQRNSKHPPGACDHQARPKEERDREKEKRFSRLIPRYPIHPTTSARSLLFIKFVDPVRGPYL